MKTKIIKFLSFLALMLFAFSLTACDQLTDAEIETIKDLLNANDITTEQLRALELTPEVKDVICDIIADECEKKGVEIDREYLKSLDLDFTALAEYKVDEEQLKAFRENMNWDPAITKEILTNAGVDEAEFNEKIKETGLTEDELLVVLEAANESDVTCARDVLDKPKVRDIDVNLHIDVPELGVDLKKVSIGEIMDAYDESAAFAKNAGVFLNGVGVPVDDVVSYFKPEKITASDVIKYLQPVGEAAQEVAKEIDPTLIRDIIEKQEIDINKLVPVEGYDEIILEAQNYVDELIDENVPDDLAKFIGLVLAVDHSNE